MCSAMFPMAGGIVCTSFKMGACHNSCVAVIK